MLPVDVHARGVNVGVGVGEGAGGTSRLQPSLVPREVKLSRPSTFSGKKTEVDNFIFEMTQYVDSVGLGTGGTACRFVVSHLKGDALTWWRSYSGDSTRVFNTLELDVLLDALKAHFAEIDEEMKLRDRLLNLRQTSSVTAYVTDFRHLQLRLGSNRVEDSMAFHLFLTGLKAHVREKVMMESPNSFEDLVLLAERVDQSQWWRHRDLGRGRSVYGGRHVGS